MANIATLLKVLLPKKANPKGVSATPTFNPSNTNNILAAPAYREHLTDIFSSRQSLDSRALVKDLFVTDPDMSATVNAFLTVADTQPVFLVKDPLGQVDTVGQAMMQQLLTFLTTRNDYTAQKFKVVQSLNYLAESMRYMLLLRGAIGAELVVSKEFAPSEIRLVDMGYVEWYEKASAQYTPQQRDKNGTIISLDIPTFFVTWFRRDPTNIFANSPFVSSINTIASRQQVINDLYRIMKLTGFPRMDVTILEDVLLKNAPAEAKVTPASQSAYLQQQMSAITTAINGIRPDQTFVHTDSVKPAMLNEKSSASTLNIDSVMSALNAQNQAGMRTMATIIGRGESGVNTATVEARVFSMNAEQLNKPVADALSQILTLALRLQGSESHVVCSFQPVELRSEGELEANRLIRAQRLKSDLSLGIISDEEYSLMVYNRLPLPGAPLLSGTNFDGVGAIQVDVTGQSTQPTAGDKAAKAKNGSSPARSNAMGKGRVTPSGTPAGH